MEVAAAMESPAKTGIPIKSHFNRTAAKHKKYSATGNTRLASAIGLHDEATATAIRNIESSAMEREEEYRREWKAERGLGTSLGGSKAAIFQGTPFANSAKQQQPPPQPMSPTPAKSAVSSPHHDAIFTPRTDAIPHSSKKSPALPAAEMSVDAALAYLSSSRRIILADRYVRKDYFWKVNSDTMEGKEVFVLRWRDLDSEAVVGHLFTSDIQNVAFAKNNPNLLEISVGTAPRALVGTGGRAVVSLLFPSEVECKKYGKSVMAIIRR